MLRCLATNLSRWARKGSGRTVVVMFGLCLATTCLAQAPIHYDHQGVMPPGMIGARQLERGGPLAGYFQPVEFKAPQGVAISLAVGGTFNPPSAAPVKSGMLVGGLYRIRVTGIPMNPGRDLYPTIEIIDRLYTPRGQEGRFAIPIELTQEDLELALAGKFVTRVIYLEDPENAAPAYIPPMQNWLDVGPGRDPLAVADALGRPMAILRMGARMPDDQELNSPGFLFGCPPLTIYPPQQERPMGSKRVGVMVPVFSEANPPQAAGKPAAVPVAPKATPEQPPAEKKTP